jgi:hypothetical protein
MQPNPSFRNVFSISCSIWGAANVTLYPFLMNSFASSKLGLTAPAVVTRGSVTKAIFKPIHHTIAVKHIQTEFSPSNSWWKLILSFQSRSTN